MLDQGTHTLFLVTILSPFYLFFFSCYVHHRDLHSFPTRRSSDLVTVQLIDFEGKLLHEAKEALWFTEAGSQQILKNDSKIGRATSELQSRENLVCRLLLEKKKIKTEKKHKTKHNNKD